MKTKKQPTKTRPLPASTATGKSSSQTQLQALSTNQLNDGWERFWFSPRRYASLRLVRIGSTLAVACLVVSFFGEIGGWFAGDGMLNSDRLGRLVTSTGVETLANWQVSLLYLIDSTPWLQGYLIALLAIACCVGFGIGGRVMIALLWFGFLSLANRQWVLVGTAEFLMASTLPCLLIAGSHPATNATNKPHARWTYGLATRLLQVQAVLFLAATVAAQIYQGIWTQGEGTLRALAGNPWLGGSGYLPLISHSIGKVSDAVLVGLPILALGLLLLVPRWRKAAVAMVWIYCLLIGIISGSGLLMLAWGTLFAIFWPTEEQPLQDKS